MLRILAISIVVSSWPAYAVFSGTRLSDQERANLIRKAVSEIAEAVKRADETDTKRKAQGLARELQSLAELEWLFAHRNRRGFGVGEKPGAITPDGIELKITALAKSRLSETQLKDEAKAIEQMGFVVAAIGEVQLARQSRRDQDLWVAFAKEMREAGISLAKSARHEVPRAIQQFAADITVSCGQCHARFK